MKYILLISLIFQSLMSFATDALSVREQRLNDLNLISLKAMVMASAYEQETLIRLLENHNIEYDHLRHAELHKNMIIGTIVLSLFTFSQLGGVESSNPNLNKTNKPVFKLFGGMMLLGIISIVAFSEIKEHPDFAMHLQDDEVQKDQRLYEYQIRKSAKIATQRLALILDIRDPEVIKRLRKNLGDQYIKILREKLVQTYHSQVSMNSILINSGVAIEKVRQLEKVQDYFSNIEIENQTSFDRQRASNDLIEFSRGLLKSLKENEKFYDEALVQTISDLEITMKALEKETNRE